MEGSDPPTCGIVAMQIFPSLLCMRVKAQESSKILAAHPKVGRCSKRQEFRSQKCELGEDHELFELWLRHRPPRPELQQKTLVQDLNDFHSCADKSAVPKHVGMRVLH